VRPRKKISQTQLAKELGVSQALVSLALNGRSVGINPDTYKRIWEHAVSLGYLPKGMRVDSTPDSARAKQIGFILRAPLRLYIPSAYFGHVQHGLHQELEARGYRAVYLGAEDELTPERAKLYSRLHPRCGTSFLLIVMIIAIFIFAPIGLPAWWILVITRILGVPVIAGLSFEVIKWAGRNRARRWVQVIMYPGLQLQKLTTREPDLDQLAVAIAGLKAVLERETPGELTAEDLLGVEVVA